MASVAAGDELFPPEEFCSCEADYINESVDESQRLLELDSSSDEEVAG